MDDARDQSMPPEEALAVAENVRLHDGIVIARAGQTLVSDNMDGSIIGMVETDDDLGGSLFAPHVVIFDSTYSDALLDSLSFYADPLLAPDFDIPPVTYDFYLGDGSAPVAGVGGSVMLSQTEPAVAGTYRARVTGSNANGTCVAGLAYTRFGPRADLGNASGYPALQSFDQSPELWGFVQKAAAGTTISYDFRASRGIITSWSIDFGDATIITGSGTPADWTTAAVGTHAYGGDGTYTLAITLTGPNGTYVSNSIAVTVTGGVETASAAQAFLGNNRFWWHLPETGKTVTFSFTFTGGLLGPGADFGPIIDQWDLDYGDGTAHVSGTGTVRDLYLALGYLTHTYAADGTYLSTLKLYSAATPFLTMFTHVVVAAGSITTGNYMLVSWQTHAVALTLDILGPAVVPVKDAAGLTWAIDFGDGTGGISGSGTIAACYAAVDAASGVVVHTYPNTNPRTVTLALTSASYNVTLTASVTVPASLNPADVAVGYFY
jgi:hypothetical protein